ncbi:MAG: hypothetical protein JWP75_3256, partial [Frondihabitans sp.]|nr:hypothetical protein [Frondihabitans sp.]
VDLTLPGEELDALEGPYVVRKPEGF